MKRLFLIRHAKSDWTTAVADDHDRPLAPRGKAACRSVGRFLSSLSIRPDLIVTSSATRARTTVERVARVARWTCPIEVSARLYDCSSEQALDFLRGLPDEVSTVLAGGHEPTWSTLGSRLVGGGNLKMVTGSVGRIDIDCWRWNDVRPGSGTLAWLVTPKTIAAMET